MSFATQSLELSLRQMEPVALPVEEQRGVADLLRLIEDLDQRAAPAVPACELVGPDGRRTAVPPAIFSVLEVVAEVLARGDSITVIPLGKELTTQQAANVLNVSRQYLVRLLEEGRIPFTKTGTHRRLRMEDVMAFKKQRDKERRAALRELTQLTEDMGGYDSEDK